MIVMAFLHSQARLLLLLMEGAVFQWKAAFDIFDFSHLLASRAGGSAHIIHCHGTRCREPENMPQVVLEVV